MAIDSSDPLVSGKNIGARSGDKWLVRDVDISISRGEIVTLIGPNGSGKSTIAKMVSGVLQPSAGAIERAKNLRIGYVPQKLNIDWTFPLTVGRLLRLTRAHSQSEIVAALKTTGMENQIDAPVQQLSGGEFQRVLLARAMVAKPDLLVLDEPVQGVDYTGQSELYHLIEDLRTRTHCGILMISHDLHVVMAQTDKVICLNGHVCCSGTPDSVARDPRFLELFGQDQNPTHAFYTHHHDHTHAADGKICNAGSNVDGPSHV